MSDDWKYAVSLIICMIGVGVGATMLVVSLIASSSPVRNHVCHLNGLSVKLDSDNEPSRWIWVEGFKCSGWGYE